ncbi:MAG: long-chain fatty acid--CoA ligase [Desulfurivibrio sp.]|nr:MAG: long-chain fatty acid--CoA ligase [Desulfurivibrio sp.]
MPKITSAAETLNELAETSCRKFAERPALSLAFHQPITYGELFDRLISTASVLQSSGIRKKDKVAILAENSPNWAIAYLAAIRLGAIVVPILPDFPEADVRHILTDAKVKILFTTQRQIEKIYELRDSKLSAVIMLDDTTTEKMISNVETFSAFLAKADQLRDKCRQLADRPPTVGPDDLAGIIYTSGTSGHSKAVMLSHDNLCANVNSANELIRITPDWTFLSILPMSHTYEFTIGFLLPLLNGARIVYAGKPPTPTTLEKICKKEKPSVICIVPMVMEKIYKKRVMTAIEENALLKFSMKVPLIRRSVFQKIGKKLLAFFGGNLQLLAIGGAATNYETEVFLKEAGFPYLIGYGLTEASPLLSGGPFKDPTITVGSAGKPVPGVEIRISRPDPQTGIGEIMAHGPNIMQGYANQADLTAQTIDREGWLATGDLGCFDESGNLHIKGRSKNVIVLSNGENIYPEAIEEKINAAMHVIESLVLENNDQLEARVYLDYDLINQQTKNKSQQQQKEYINQLLKEIQRAVNSQLAPYSRIHRIIERQEPFIKTATHKIKRYLYAQ